MIISSNKKLSIVSFDTVTCQDLQFFIDAHGGYSVERIDPYLFLTQIPESDKSYINLVLKDFDLRKQITNYFDKFGVDRFSMLHDQSHYTHSSVGPGCVLYPMVTLYPQSKLQKDIIVHSMTAIAHKSHIGTGCYISGGCIIAGESTVGEFTQFGISVSVYDNVSIPSDSIIGAGSVVRKSLSFPGTYTGQIGNKLVKLKW